MAIPVTDAQAEAVKATAEMGTTALQLVGASAAFLQRTVGNLVENGLGLIASDWITEKRKRNLARLQAQTARIIASFDEARISEPSPSLVKPLAEAAMDESREELVELWAAMLAAAMIDGGKFVRRAMFTAIEKLEPPDVLEFNVFVGLSLGEDQRFEAGDGLLQAGFRNAGLTRLDIILSTKSLVMADLLIIEGTTNRLSPLGVAIARLVAVTDTPKSGASPAT